MSTIGAKIDTLFGLREQKREIEAQLKVLAEKMAAVELTLIEQMDKEGVLRSTGKSATVSVTTSIKPSVEDWDTFYAFIHRHKYYHLLERRPSVGGYRELMETKGKVPGVVPFTQRTLNMRAV